MITPIDDDENNFFVFLVVVIFPVDSQGEKKKMKRSKAENSEREKFI